MTTRTYPDLPKLFIYWWKHWNGVVAYDEIAAIHHVFVGASDNRHILCVFSKERPNTCVQGDHHRADIEESFATDVCAVRQLYSECAGGRGWRIAHV